MSKYLTNRLEPVDLSGFEPADVLRYVHALRTNPIYQSILYSCAEQARILQATKCQATGLDGLIERSNTVVQSQSLFIFDTFVDELEENAREQMNEDRQKDLFDS